MLIATGGYQTIKSHILLFFFQGVGGGKFQRTQSLVAFTLTEDQDFLWQKMSLRNILNFGLFLSNN